MYNVNIFSFSDNVANIEELSIKRDWMDEVPSHGAYNCFPLTLANKFGIGISFPEKISFKWNGEMDKANQILDIYEGKDFCYVDRGLGTIAFNTNLTFETDENVSTLIMPVPNQYIEGLQVLTSIISTSFFSGSIHIVCKITKPNYLIEIEKNTPIATFLPISLNQFENSNIYINKDIFNRKNKIIHDSIEYGNALKEYGLKYKKPANWYRNAIDQNENIIGKHELMSFKFNIIKEKNV